MVFKHFFILTKWQVILLLVFLVGSSIPANQLYGPCTACHGFPIPFWSDHYEVNISYITLLVVAFVVNFLFWNVIAGLFIFMRIRFHQ